MTSCWEQERYRDGERLLSCRGKCPGYNNNNPVNVSGRTGVGLVLVG